MSRLQWNRNQYHYDEIPRASVLQYWSYVPRNSCWLDNANLIDVYRYCSPTKSANHTIDGLMKFDELPFIQCHCNDCRSLFHDDVIKWKHFPRYWPFVRGIHRSPVNSPHKGQWRGALMFTLISAWINGWVNNREAGDSRRHHAHYDVTVMY